MFPVRAAMCFYNSDFSENSHTVRSLLPVLKKETHFPCALHAFLRDSTTMRRALIRAYFLSLDSRMYQGAKVVLVFWSFSLTASSYWSHFSRLRQSSSVIFHCFSGVFWRSVNRSSCVWLSICTQNLMTTAPHSASSFSNSFISL